MSSSTWSQISQKLVRKLTRMADNKDEINNQQHFIELDSMIDAKGQLYTFQLLTDEWISPVKE